MTPTAKITQAKAPPTVDLMKHPSPPFHIRSLQIVFPLLFPALLAYSLCAPYPRPDA